MNSATSVTVKSSGKDIGPKRKNNQPVDFEVSALYMFMHQHIRKEKQIRVSG